MQLDKAIAIHSRIAKKEKQCADLLVQLERSIAMQAIWPDAFLDGQTCSFGGIHEYDSRMKVHISFTRAQFTREDGTEFRLTAEQVLQFKPDAMINKRFKAK